VVIASAVEEVQQRTRRQQQERQKWHELGEVCAMLSDEEVRGNENEAEKYQSRRVPLAIGVIRA
jgi:hypothetical protein